MAKITLKGQPVNTIGDLPRLGSNAPGFVLTGKDMNDVNFVDFAGRRVVLNIHPSIDTSVCAMSVRRFNQEAAALPGTTVLSISMDLPFAQARFCGAEGIANVVTLSAFRNPEFGRNFGVTMTDGPLRGLFSRAVVVLDTKGRVVYTQQVPEIAEEPDYKSAMDAARAA